MIYPIGILITLTVLMDSYRKIQPGFYSTDEYFSFGAIILLSLLWPLTWITIIFRIINRRK